MMIIQPPLHPDDRSAFEITEMCFTAINEVNRLMFTVCQTEDECRKDVLKLEKYLKDHLTQQASLRNKDFDGWMLKLLELMVQYETRIKKEFHYFLLAQQNLMFQLCKEFQWDCVRVAQMVKQQVMKEIEKMMEQIIMFYQRWIGWIQQLQTLLQKGSHLTFQELKATLNELVSESSV